MRACWTAWFARRPKRAEEIRLVADYKSDSVELSDAQAMVLQAETFVAAMHAKFVPNSPSGDE